MKQIALIACLALLLPLAGCGPHSQNPPSGAATSATAQGAASPNTASSASFDFYLLNLSWSPEFCFSHPPPQSVPRIPPLSSTACGRKTTTAPIRKIVRMRPALRPGSIQGHLRRPGTSCPRMANARHLFRPGPRRILLCRPHRLPLGRNTAHAHRSHVADIASARSDPRSVHSQQSCDSAFKPRLELRP